jgi:NAD(P)-dependent dehydrogenase (short-subunit alcohol dehydrogenase family)
VIATCRRSSAELDELGVQVVDAVDVTEAGSAARLSEAVGDAALDLLVVNAGVNLSFDVDRIDDLDLALVEEELLVNAAGAARTVLAVLPRLGRGSKILLVSSGVTRPGRPGVGSIGYTMSKAALNFFGRALAHDVRERGIVVVLVSPGATDTDIIRRVDAAGRNPLPAGTVNRDPLDSARNVLGIVERATLESSGTFWGPAGETYFTPDGTPAVG